MVLFNDKRSGMKIVRNVLMKLTSDDVESVGTTYERIYGLPTYVHIHKYDGETLNFRFTDNEFRSIKHMIPKL